MAENQAPNAAADVEMSQYVADRTRVNEDKIKQDDEIIQQFGDYTYGWHDTDFAGEAAKKALTRMLCVPFPQIRMSRNGCWKSDWKGIAISSTVRCLNGASI